ncbi:hypothetical protein K474DRAFT_1704310 [Panus rudis PR-1116 ss-1]|nr:hypothetical protein K474DRAFT_1704310 [Panus rudis PR-1116 ss-1]
MSTNKFPGVSGKIPASPSPVVETCLSWLSAITQADVDTINSLLHEDFVCEVLPPSVGIPVRNKKEWVGFIGGGFHKFFDFRFNILQIVAGEDSVVAYATSTAKTVTGGDYSNVYAFFWDLTKDENGQFKITHVKEFMDSLYAASFFAAENERAEATGTEGLTRSG